ncbi:MAG: hypothetical protein GF313_04580 [Caldithrix sp.]|nr:hypothetical protein [Caldithrix sp.]
MRKGMDMKSLKDLLDTAIEQEVESQKLYRQGADMVNDKETQQFLRRLEKEEIEHEKMLFNIKETRIYDLSVSVNDEELLQDVKTSHGSNQLTFDKEQTIEEIFEIALKREYMAQRRYEIARDAVVEDELKQLFQSLADQEANHHRDVEKQFNIIKGDFGPEM